MTSVPGDRSELIGPGRLVLVVGPSGAGKDTLIELALACCSGDRSIVFPQRVVTRAASSSENNVVVSAEHFAHLLAGGAFALHWHAHGLSYGLSVSVIDEIQAGRTVVANVSRTVIETARRLYVNVTVVLVTAPPEILAQRIAGRSRASDGRLEDRLQRAVAISAPDLIINNIGEAQDHAFELFAVIK